MRADVILVDQAPNGGRVAGRAGRAEDSSRGETEELARDAPVEEVDALCDGQADEPGERAAAGEDSAAPPGAAAKHVAECPVQRFQILVLTDPFAVGRVTQNR